MGKVNTNSVEYKRRVSEEKYVIKMLPKGSKNLKNHVFTHRDLSMVLDCSSAKIYGYLKGMCFNKEYCYPKREQIVHDTKINKNKLTAILQHLENLGLVEIRRRKGGTWFNNVYYMPNIDEISERDDNGNIIELQTYGRTAGKHNFEPEEWYQY